MLPNRDNMPDGQGVPFSIEKGSRHPLGATSYADGVNFSLFSGNATGVELLFAAHDAPQPFQTIQLDPYVNKTFHFWHVYVRGLKAGGIEAFLRREVLPHAPDAWYDPASVKTGYEISFTRYFYKPQPMRTLEEIRADILALEKEAEGLLGEIVGGALK
jgi:pullulanase/glycogen debranching enzyme